VNLVCCFVNGLLLVGWCCSGVGWVFSVGWGWLV